VQLVNPLTPTAAIRVQL